MRNLISMVTYGKPYWPKVVEIFLFKSRFFIQVKNSFFEVRVSIQVEIFFIQVKMFQFKSRFFFLVEIQVYLKSRIFSHVEIFIASEEFFSRRDFYPSREFFSCREFFHAKIFPFKARFVLFVVKIFHVEIGTQ